MTETGWKRICDCAAGSDDEIVLTRRECQAILRRVAEVCASTAVVEAARLLRKTVGLSVGVNDTAKRERIRIAERRVLDLLRTATLRPAAEVRAEALREAAEVCDDEEQRQYGDGLDRTMRDRSDGCAACADRLRAMAEETET